MRWKVFEFTMWLLEASEMTEKVGSAVRKSLKSQICISLSVLELFVIMYFPSSAMPFPVGIPYPSVSTEDELPLLIAEVLI